ncbi:MAG TPA: universal stress protein [Microlunatus sp.]|nr:universal stress protein [Microlunatus sp.]
MAEQSLSTEPDEQPYTVVVGVSVTSKSPAALAWAAAQAEANHGRVVAVRAWRLPNPQATPSGTSAGRIARAEEVEAAALTTFEQDVTDTLGAGHAADLRLVRGGKLKVLLQAAVGADLLVVDAPRQLVAGPMFAHRLVYAASCPVVVMPPRVSGEPASALSRVAGALGRSVVAAAGTAGRPGYRPPPRT